MVKTFTICQDCANEIKSKRGRAWADITGIRVISMELTPCSHMYPCYLCGVATEGGARSLTLDFGKEWSFT